MVEGISRQASFTLVMVSVVKQNTMIRRAQNQIDQRGAMK